MTLRRCPCCGNLKTAMSVEDVDFLDTIPFKRKQRLLVDALVSAYPRRVTQDIFEQWMWEDEGYEIPECKTHIFSHVSKARNVLERHGWTIEAKRFVGWRLVKLNSMSEAA